MFSVKLWDTVILLVKNGVPGLFITLFMNPISLSVSWSTGGRVGAMINSSLIF